MSVVIMYQLPVLAVLLTTMTVSVTGQAKPGCPDRCGSTDIPYPFGIGKGCYLDDTIHSFSVVCRQPNKPLVWGNTIPLLDVSLDGHLRVSLSASYNCHDLSTGQQADNFENLFSFSQFLVSDTRNKLITVGCNIYSTLQDPERKKYLVGCMSRCLTASDLVDNRSCSGRGCCQSSIPKGMRGFRLTASSFEPQFNGNNNGEDGYGYAAMRLPSCGYAFLVEEGKYTYDSSDLESSRKIRDYPVVLEWWVGQENCQTAQQNPDSYACKSQNSYCFDSDNGPGYRCNCTDGYTGNPYLLNGCRDINECNNPSLNHCVKPENCQNVEGNYTCPCPKGQYGDGKTNGSGCRVDPLLTAKIIVGIIISLLTLLLGLSWVYWIVRHRKIIKLREKFFERNGGILLRRQLSRLRVSRETTKVFSAEDLKKATNNYHESRILGQGGQGTVYKGILPGNQMVAIKKAKIGDGSQVEQFINEVIILSQINHRNVVKLLGCCLETEVPLLVYEFVTNGSLFDHMHDSRDGSVVPWGIRLKIAIETAGALSYLHSAASIPIIHRDIKSANILLDDNYTAKVSDFGASRFIPADQEQLTTLVQGTLGYLDPEYFTTSHLTEKSDVYSFGVVLLELITGRKALSFARVETERNLVSLFVLAVEENHVAELLDHRIVNTENYKQLRGVADLAMRCVIPQGEKRPTMKEVAMELEGLRAMGSCCSESVAV